MGPFYEIKAMSNFLTGCDPVPFLAKNFRDLSTAFVLIIINSSLNKYNIR